MAAFRELTCLDRKTLVEVKDREEGEENAKKRLERTGKLDKQFSDIGIMPRKMT